MKAHNLAAQRFMQAMQDRFACKWYKPERIEPQLVYLILEAGRLSPTSFGLEGWHFHVVQSATLRTEMTAACFNQESVATAPISIVITALKTASYEPYGAFVSQRGKRFPGTLQEFVDDYIGYYDFLLENGRIDCWSRSQCYIAAANMMQAGATVGIQSCAIEGFDEDKVAKILQLDTNVWQIAMVITFGYPNETIREKIREPLEALTSYY